MRPYNEFSCFIIGEGTLPIQCAEILLQRGHRVYGIISPADSLHRWAKEKGIPHCHPRNDDLLALMSARPFDYLFSIVNRYVIPADVLTLPVKYPINYHDAPLPRYAGVYATSWAIMQGEKTHGITWHVMTEQVDAGDILKQPLVDIAPDDTALTLNAKCYEAAIGAFAELVDDLARDRVTPTQQNLADRTYFSLYQRPPAGCVLSWKQEAEKIEAFVRALAFGSYPNRLGLPKLAIEQDFVIVSQVDLLESKSGAFPGTITHIGSDTLVIATISNDIAIQKLLTIDGRPLSISDFVKQYSLQTGNQLGDLDSEIADRLTTRNAAICKHESFWVKKLAALQSIELPYVNQAILSDTSRRSVALPLTIPDKVAVFIANRDWMPSDFLLSAFVAYLVRLTDVGCFDIGFRPLTLSRYLTDLESFFASCVPLRVDIDVTQLFAQAHRAIQAQVDLSIENQSYARDVVSRYPELGQSPVFPVAVAQVESLADYQPQSNNGLTFVIPQNSTEYQWVYDPQILDSDNANRMMKQFTTFLRGIASQPEQPLWELPLLTKAEQHQLLTEWNDTQVDYPHNVCLHELFEAQVEQTPDAIALVFEDQRLTYRELNQRANQLAHHLRTLGVGPEVIVSICLERSLEMMVGILGILKAGGAYVPLDPGYPRERLALMLEDTRAPVLLTQQRLVKQLPGHEAQVVCLDTDWATISRESEENPISNTTPETMAYVIYTSGTTGRPKGVVVQHRSVLNLLTALHQAIYVRQHKPQLGISLNGPLAFDTSVKQLIQLLNGHTLYILPSEIRLDGDALLAYMQRHQLDVFDCTPSQLELLLAAGLLLRPGHRPGVVLVAGEAIDDRTWQTLARSTQTAFYNLYGPTECTVDATVGQVRGLAGKPTIGRPLANTQIYILNQHLQPVPIGVAGELYIGGAGLARGYLNRPALTAEKFIPKPFSDEPGPALSTVEGTRLYQTGDLARYLPDGNIEFLGRLDYQVKMRGFRLELGEIEAVLNQHPAVREVVVMAWDAEPYKHEHLGGREAPPWDKRLVAYFVPAQETAPAFDELRSFLKRKLPDYMIPSAFVKLEALPRTSQGKLDRRALLTLDINRPELKETYVAPRNPVEELLTNTWAQVLGLEKVGICDNFFELGGHSLLATQVISRIRNTFQVGIPLRDLFEAPTIAELALVIEEILIEEIEELAEVEVQCLLQ